MKCADSANMCQKDGAELKIDKMSAILHREFVLENPQRWIAAQLFIESNWHSLAKADTPLRIIISTQEEKRREQQNKYYWAVVIRSIADQAWVDGKRFSGEVWHEHVARMFGILKDVTLPDSIVIQKRLSTTEMTVKEFSEYIENVTAWGASELGIRYPAMDI